MADFSLNYDPQTLGTTDYGDLLISNGRAVLTSDAGGTNPTLQLITQRLRLLVGEWFLNTSDGVPWLQQILVKNAKASTVDALLQDCILATPGVASLVRYEATAHRAQRRYSVSFTVTTQKGVQVSSTVAINP